MLQLFKIFIILLFLSTKVFGQENKILVAQTTVKINSMGTEELYFGFDKGDQIIFNYELVKGKDLKEIEMFEYPNASVFMEYKTKIIKDKTIFINRKGIYKFNFRNTALGVRICKVKVERIPENVESEKFNTTAYWKTLQDTNYYSINEKYLISKDTMIHNITKKVVKVHSSTNANGNKSTFNFLLPQNTVSWSYYVGVNQEGQEVLENATKEITKKATSMLSKLSGYGPMAALALGSTSYIVQLQKGEDIDFYIVEGQNVNLFLAGNQFYYIKKGKVINDFSKITSPLRGNLHFCFNNDNAITGVKVTVNITAVTVKENWGIRKVEQYSINSRKEPYIKE